MINFTQPEMSDIRVAALRVLEAIIVPAPTSRSQMLRKIIDVTEAASHHGLLPVIVQSCVASLTGQQLTTSNGNSEPYSLPLAAALFSFLYALASCEAGREALIACRMIETLVPLISRPGPSLHTSFVKRAVQIIDLIADMHAFQVRFSKYLNHNGTLTHRVLI